jgi:hypothetical protein
VLKFLEKGGAVVQNGKIDGTNQIILQSLLLALSKEEEEVLRIRRAIGETIERVGKEVLGEQEGDGQFVLRPEQDGSFNLSWELKPKEAPPEEVPQDNKIIRHRRRAK